MTTTYRPVLKLAIPEDVTDPQARVHAQVRIEHANTLLAKYSYATRQDAIGRAAIVLSNSGVSACAIPSAEPMRSRDGR